MVTKDKILAIATELFTQHGENYSLSQIAIAVGFKKQSVYNYFDNKDELTKAIIAREMMDYFQERRRSFGNLKTYENPVDKLEYIFFDILNYFKNVDKARFWRWIMFISNEEISLDTNEIIRKKELKYISALNKIFDECVEKKIINIQDKLGLLYRFMALQQGLMDAYLIYNDIIKAKKQIVVEEVWKSFRKSIDTRL